MARARVPELFDAGTVAVITGGASGFGLEASMVLAENGMRIAICDIFEDNLAKAKALIEAVAGAGNVLTAVCDVSRHEQCVQFADAVDAWRGSSKIAFVFNNAGIAGPGGGTVKLLTPKAQKFVSPWSTVFAVNVYGAANIINVFVPRLVEQGPQPSGKPLHFTTTSSVVGLVSLTSGPYSASKMAVTGLTEQLCFELEDEGEDHILPSSLHPSMAGTGFFTTSAKMGMEKVKKTNEAFTGALAKKGLDAHAVVNGLFEGLRAGKTFVLVNGPGDVPIETVLQDRVKSIIDGTRPTVPPLLGDKINLVGQVMEEMVSKL